MKARTHSVKVIARLFGLIVLVLVLGTCDMEFRSGEDLRDIIETQAQETLAESTPVTVMSADANAGVTTPSGIYTEAKKGIWFNISATVTDGYAFDTWTNTGTGVVEFENASVASTRAKVTTPETDSSHPIKITAKYNQRPYISKWKPGSEADNQLVNSPIRITFSEVIDPNSVKVGDTIHVLSRLSDQAGVDYTDISDQFDTPSILPLAEPNMVTLTLKSGVKYGAFFDVHVTVANIKDSTGVLMAGTAENTFYTGSLEDKGPPVITDLTLSNGSKTLAPSATVADFSSVPGLTAVITATDDQGVQNIKFVETECGKLGNEIGIPQTSTVGWGTSTDYALKTGGNKYAKLAIYVLDSSSNISQPVTYLIGYDTDGPTIGTISLTNTEGVTNLQTPGISSSDVSDVMSGIGTYRYSVNSGSWVTSSGNFVSGTSTLDLGSSQGTKVVDLQVYDKAGNLSSSTSTSVIYDSAAPVIGTVKVNGTAVSAGGLVKTKADTFTLNVAYTDTSYSSSGASTIDLDYSLDGGSTWTAVMDYANASNLTVTIPAGKKNLLDSVKVRLSDRLGQTCSPFGFSLRHDNTGPTLGTLSLSDIVSGFTKNAAPKVSGTVSDDGVGGTIRYAVSLDGSSFGAASTYASGTSTASLGSGGDGDRTVYLRFYDSLGNYSTIASPFNVNLDQTAPAITSLTIDNTGGWSGTATPVITSVLDDGIGSSTSLGTYTYQVKTDSGSFTAASNFSSGTSTASLGSTEGSHTVVIRFTDLVGNYVDSTVQTIGLDTSAPDSLALKIDGATVSTGTTFSTKNTGLTLNLNYGDKSYESDGTSTITLQYWINGSWTSVADYNKVQDEVMSGFGSNTDTPVKVRLIDRFNHASSEISVTVRHDDKKPSMTLGTVNGKSLNSVATLPAYYSSVSGPALTGTLADNNLPDGVTFSYKVDSGSYVTGSTFITSSLTQALSSLGTGAHDISWYLTDKAGNESDKASFRVVYDNTAPVFAGTMKVEGSAIESGSGKFYTKSATPEITNVVNEENADAGYSVAYTISGATTKTGSVTLYTTSFSLVLPTLNEGSNTVVMTMTDAAGKSTSTTVTVVYDNSAPSYTGTQKVDSKLVNGTTSKFYTTSNTPVITDTVNEASAVLGYTVDYTISGATTATGSVTLYTSSFSLTLPTLDEGSNTVDLTLTDIWGKTTSTTVTVVYDNTVPSFTGTRNVDAKTINGTTSKFYTTSNTPVITDTVTEANADAGYTVAYTITGATSKTGSVTLYTTSFSLTLPALNEGENTVGIIITDAAGKTNTSASVKVVYDNTSPSYTGTRKVDSNVINGTTNKFYTTSSTPVITDTVTEANAVAGYTVAYTISGATTKTGTVTLYSTSFSLTLPALNEGDNTVAITITDAAGKTNTSASVEVVYDNTAPSYTGTRKVDSKVINGTTSKFYTTSSTPVITDTVTEVNADAGYTVAYNISGATAKTGSVTLYTTSFSLTLPALNEGSNAVSITMTDAAGKAGTVVIDVVYDNTAPVFNGTMKVEGSAIESGSGKFYTKSATPEITNMVTEVNADAGYTVTYNISGATTKTGSVTLYTTSFSLVLPTLNEGSSIVAMTMTDSAGKSTSTTVTVVYDNSAPSYTGTQKVDSKLVNGITSKFYTATSTPVITDTVNEASAVLGYTVAYTISGATTATGSVTLYTSSFSLTLPTLDEGSNTVDLTLTDIWGKTTSTTVTVVYDNTVPSFTGTRNVDAKAINGTTSKFYTTSNTPVITDTVTEANADAGYTVAYTITGATSKTGSVTLYTTSFSLPLPALNEGENTVGITMTDAVGKSTSTTVTVVYDNTTPSFTGTRKVDTKVINGTTSKFYTSSSTPVITDTVTEANADAGYTVAYNITGDTTKNGSIILNSSSFSLPLPALNEGSNIVAITMTDAAGKSTSTTVTVVYDNSAPSYTGTRKVDSKVINGTTSKFYTTSSTPVITDTVTEANADAGYTVAYTITGATPKTGSVILYTTSFSLTLPALNEGDNTVAITITDAAGKTNTSASVEVVYDNTAPSFTGTRKVDTKVINGTTSKFYTSSSTPVITDTVTEANADAGYTVAYNITGDTTKNGSIILNSSSFSLPLPALNEGSNIVAITMTDAAGKSTSTTVTVVYDNSAPSYTGTRKVDSKVINGTTSKFYTNSSTPVITDMVTEANADAGYTVAYNITGDTTKNGSVTLNSSSFSLPLPALNEGSNTVAITITDIVGKVGTATIEVVYDNTVPVFDGTMKIDGSVIDSGSVKFYTSSSTPEITNSVDEANADAGYTVAYTITGPTSKTGSVVLYTTSVSLTLPTLNEGSNSVAIVITDAAGKVSITTTITVVFDNSAPTISGITVGGNSLMGSVYYTNNAAPVFAATVSEASAVLGYTIDYTITGATSTSGSSSSTSSALSFTLPTLNTGASNIAYTLTDNFSHTSSSASIVVNCKVVSISSQAAVKSGSNNVVLTFTLGADTSSTLNITYAQDAAYSIASNNTNFTPSGTSCSITLTGYWNKDIYFKVSSAGGGSTITSTQVHLSNDGAGGAYSSRGGFGGGFGQIPVRVVPDSTITGTVEAIISGNNGTALWFAPVGQSANLDNRVNPASFLIPSNNIKTAESAVQGSVLVTSTSGSDSGITKSNGIATGMNPGIPANNLSMDQSKINVESIDHATVPRVDMARENRYPDLLGLFRKFELSVLEDLRASLDNIGRQLSKWTARSLE